MKTVSPTIICLLVCAVAVGAALEFSGYMILGGRSLFTFRKLQSGKSSDWLMLGDSFEGYTLTEFDLHAEAITLARGTEIVRLPLKSSRVTARSSNIAEAQILVTENGRTLFRIVVGEDLRPSLNGQPFRFGTWDSMCAGFAARGADVLVRISYPTGKKPMGFSFWLTRITNGARGANLQTVKVVFDR